MIVYQSRIYRADLVANPDVLYLFGDNLQRVGMGGQAGEMRGEPNAVGIATKKAPSSGEFDFFSDYEYGENVASIIHDYERAREHDYHGGIVICPLDGLGTGLSDMPNRCPKTFDFLRRRGLGGKP